MTTSTLTFTDPHSIERGNLFTVNGSNATLQLIATEVTETVVKLTPYTWLHKVLSWNPCNSIDLILGDFEC